MRPFLSISPRPPASHRCALDRPGSLMPSTVKAHPQPCGESKRCHLRGLDRKGRNGLKLGPVRSRGGPANESTSRFFSAPPGLSDQKSKITQQTHKQKVWVLRLKSEISFRPTGAAKTRTGVAVHENLLDSVMAARSSESDYLSSRILCMALMRINRGNLKISTPKLMDRRGDQSSVATAEDFGRV